MKPFRRRSWAIVVAFLGSVSCEGTYDDDPTGTAGSFLLAITPAARITAPGTTTFVTVQLARTGGFSGAITLTIANTPSGVSTSMDPAILSGNTVESRVNLTVAPTTPAGTSTVALTGTSGIKQFTATFTLTIGAPN